MPDKKAYIIAGPNGSGKTTFAGEFIKETKLPFVNADEIALSLSPKNLEKVRVKAGKLFFRNIEKLIAKSSSFVVETTLAGKYFVNILAALISGGVMKKIIYEELIKLTKIGNRAVRKDQEENRRKGLPSVYSKNKRLYYELPDGTITMKNPLPE